MRRRLGARGGHRCLSVVLILVFYWLRLCFHLLISIELIRVAEAGGNLPRIHNLEQWYDIESTERLCSIPQKQTTCHPILAWAIIFKFQHGQCFLRMLGFTTGIAERSSTYGNARRDEQFWRWINQQCFVFKTVFPAQGLTLNAVAMRRALRNALVSFALTDSLCPHLRKHHLIDISLEFIFKSADIVFNDVIISGKDKPSCARGEVAGVTCGNKVPSLLYFYNYPN